MPAPDLNSDDYYKILGVSKNADDAQLKKAYRKLAVKWHPDKNPGDDQATKNFQKISEAFNTLSDSKKRKLYDQYGIEGVNAADQIDEKDIPTGGGMGGFPGGFARGGGGGVHHMSPEEAQALFGQFFGGSDPFGGMMGGGMGGGGMSMGGPGSFSHFSTSGGGPGMAQSSFTRSFASGGGGGGDPFDLRFAQGNPAAAHRMHRHGHGGMSSSMSSEQAPTPPRQYDSIPRGTVVSFKGLINAPERNGDRGVIKHYIPSTGRYVVEIEDTEETMSVKPSNLLQHVRVVVNGVQSQTELNGKTGTILAWNSNTERYNVYVMSMKKVVSLKPVNVIFANGTVAQLTGITSKPELNGKWGTIKEWMRESNKYEVQLSPQHIIRVKVESMRV